MIAYCAKQKTQGKRVAFTNFLLYDSILTMDLLLTLTICQVIERCYICPVRRIVGIHSLPALLVEYIGDSPCHLLTSNQLDATTHLPPLYASAEEISPNLKELQPCRVQQNHLCRPSISERRSSRLPQ